ncbi:MAG: KEOPS complex subunit Pcc1 [Desulfurococcaceae archaeon]
MPGEVEVAIQVSSEKCELVTAIRKALEPDNVRAPSDMKIEEAMEWTSTGECIYRIKIKVKGGTERSLKRARSTVNEVLAIVKTLGKAFELAMREKRVGGNA